jgi:hypothetical protein
MAAVVQLPRDCGIRRRSLKASRRTGSLPEHHSLVRVLESTPKSSLWTRLTYVHDWCPHGSWPRLRWRSHFLTRGIFDDNRKSDHCKIVGNFTGKVLRSATKERRRPSTHRTRHPADLWSTFGLLLLRGPSSTTTTYCDPVPILLVAVALQSRNREACFRVILPEAARVRL